MNLRRAVLFALLISAAPRAHAESPFAVYLAEAIPTFVECTFRETVAVDCANIETEFFNKYGKYFRRANSSRDATIHLKLTDRSMGGSLFRFTFEWDAKAPFSTDYRPYTVDLDTTVLREPELRTKLRVAAFRGAFIFISIASAEVDEAGDLIVKAEGKTGPAPKDNIFTRLEKSPLAVSAHGSANFSKNGPVQKSSFTSGGLEGNYSTDRYRVIGGIYLTGQSVTQPDESGASVSARNQQKAAYLLAARSLGEKRRWSVAIFTTFDSNPGNNEKSDLMGGAGIEYTLVPYRETQNQEFYVRLGSGVTKLDLELENDLGFTSSTYHFIFSEIAGYWTLFDSRLVLSGKGKVKVMPAFKGYEQYTGSVSARYRVGNAFSLNTSYSLGYQKRSLSYPNNPDYSNPLRTQFLTSAPGTSSGISFGISVNLGNSPKKASDRRWSSY